MEKMGRKMFGKISIRLPLEDKIPRGCFHDCRNYRDPVARTVPIPLARLHHYQTRAVLRAFNRRRAFGQSHAVQSRRPLRRPQ